MAISLQGGELHLPSKEQVALAVNAMRVAHFSYGYTRWPRDYYLERMFWAGFFAAYLNRERPSQAARAFAGKGAKEVLK